MSDKGFYVQKDVADCEDNGRNSFSCLFPAAFNPYKSVGVSEPEFYSDQFVYNAAKDVYVCPVIKGLLGSGVIVERVLREAVPVEVLCALFEAR